MRKAEKVEEVAILIRNYQIIGIADLYKVRASQLQEIRKKLDGKAVLRVIKNTLFEKALIKMGKQSVLDKIRDHLRGSNLFLFTNLNPFKLELILEKSRVKDFAKAGDIATEDVIVPAGNTGLPPGPIISQLSSVGIMTRIESGSVWINRDTVVARKGERISESLAPILSKLGIKAVEMGLTIKVVCDGESVLTEKELKMDLDMYKKHISAAHEEAMKVSLYAAYPMRENVRILIWRAIQEAHNLSVNSAYPCSENIRDLIIRAYYEALAISNKIPG